jgi:hypothetical protein
MKPDIQKRVIRHGENLNRIFNLSKDPVSLCRAVRRLEAEAHRFTTAHCNGEVNESTAETMETNILDSLDRLLNFRAQSIPVFVNLDARGYALKIQSEYVENSDIHKDWGGYGIIAPDLS